MTAGVKNVETTFNKATSTFSHTPDYSTNSSPSSYTTANAEDVTSEREFGGTWASKREARIGNQYPEVSPRNLSNMNVRLVTC